MVSEYEVCPVCGERFDAWRAVVVRYYDGPHGYDYEDTLPCCSAECAAKCEKFQDA